jgi:hypothetical protein
MNKVAICSIIFAAALAAGSTSATAFPAIGADSGPGFIINAGTGGTFTVTATGQGPYDSSDDTYIGVTNNSGGPVSSIALSSTATIFAFEGDGITTFAGGGTQNAQDPSGYGGPNGFFTNIVGNTGTVNFITPIPNGGTDFFSLEEDLTGAGGGLVVGSAVPEPSTWAMMIIGFAGLAFLTYRRKRNGSAFANGSTFAAA